MFFFQLVELGIQQEPELVRFNLSVNNRSEAAGQKLNGLRIPGKQGILLDNRTGTWVEHMFLQCNHAIAPPEHKQLKKHFEQVIVGGAVVRSAFKRINDALGKINQN